MDTLFGWMEDLLENIKETIIVNTPNYQKGSSGQTEQKWCTCIGTKHLETVTVPGASVLRASPRTLQQISVCMVEFTVSVPPEKKFTMVNVDDMHTGRGIHGVMSTIAQRRWLLSVRGNRDTSVHIHSSQEHHSLEELPPNNLHLDSSQDQIHSSQNNLHLHSSQDHIHSSQNNLQSSQDHLQTIGIPAGLRGN